MAVLLRPRRARIECALNCLATPTYTLSALHRYGDAAEQTAITSVIQAIIGRCEDGGDALKVICAGGSLIVFYTRGPLSLCAGTWLPSRSHVRRCPNAGHNAHTCDCTPHLMVCSPRIHVARLRKSGSAVQCVGVARRCTPSNSSCVLRMITC